MDLDIPYWFGKMEFYAVLVTIWFGLIIYLLVNIIKVKQGFKVKENVNKFKVWWLNRKKRKEEKMLGKIF